MYKNINPVSGVSVYLYPDKMVEAMDAHPFKDSGLNQRAIAHNVTGTTHHMVVSGQFNDLEKAAKMLSAHPALQFAISQGVVDGAKTLLGQTPATAFANLVDRVLDWNKVQQPGLVGLQETLLASTRNYLGVMILTSEPSERVVLEATQAKLQGASMRNE